MKPELGKTYTISYQSNNPEEGRSYMGTAECLQNMQDGTYKFILPIHDTLGYFKEEDVIAEVTSYKLTQAPAIPYGRKR